MEVALTGRLVSMTRMEAIDRIAGAGGRYVRTPGASTQVLVVGQAQGPLSGDGGLTENLARCRELTTKGARIRLIEEPEFLRALGAEEELEDFTRLYTVEQVSRIVGAPLSEVRSWLRHGLLKPARVARRLAWFGFTDIVRARGLSRLAACGIPASRIRMSLEEIARWLPEAQRMIARLDAYDRGLRVRLSNGGWAEPNGQLLLDWEDESGSSPRIAAFPGEQDSRRWFAAGVEAEERGDLESAAAAYGRALEVSPDPETWFNLGNVLYGLGREAEAAANYMRAIEADGEFAEAWNNLGNALAAVNKPGDAVSAYEMAISLEPDYPDAHCNLATILERLGRHGEALAHRGAFDRSFPDSRRLRLLQEPSAEDQLD